MKSECPRFNHCSAPVCPLDPDLRRRRYIDGDPVCFYMRELVKPGGDERVEATIGRKLTEAVREAVLGPESRHGPLQNRLKRASLTRSRLARGG